MRQPISLCLLFSLLGCGDPLTGTAYLGEPLHTVSGEVTLTDRTFVETLDLEEVTVLMSLLWARPEGLSLERQQSLLIRTAFPAQYEMVLYHPPPDDAFVAPPEAGPENAYAFAVPVAYIDDDESGALEEGELLLGTTTNGYIFYLPEDFETLMVPPGGLPLEELFGPGYHTVAFGPDTCSGEAIQPPVKLEDTDINVIISDDLTDTLRDINCDGSLDEWSLLCEGDCPAPRDDG
jgi:hypothetical protein